MQMMAIPGASRETFSWSRTNLCSATTSWKVVIAICELAMIHLFVEFLNNEVTNICQGKGCGFSPVWVNLFHNILIDSSYKKQLLTYEYVFACQDFSVAQGFLRCFRDPIRVPRISNRVPRIRENYHRVPTIRENRVPRIREIGSLQVHTGHLTFSLKKTAVAGNLWQMLLFVKCNKMYKFFFAVIKRRVALFFHFCAQIILKGPIHLQQKFSHQLKRTVKKYLFCFNWKKWWFSNKVPQSN